MRIDSARMLGGELVLTASVPDARRFVYGFKPGEYDISPPRRSAASTPMHTRGGSSTT